MAKWLRKVHQKLNTRDYENKVDMLPVEHPGKKSFNIDGQSQLITFNSDGSFQDNITTEGIIARDHNGDMIGAWGKKMHANNPVEREAKSFCLDIISYITGEHDSIT